MAEKTLPTSSAADHGCKKRLRDNPAEAEIDSPEAKRLREDLLDLLEDSDPAASTPDLDFVMQSFAEEISSGTPPSVSTGCPGEPQPDLGYLLEASDDELGLPPSTAPSEAKSGEPDPARVPFDSVEIGDVWGFGNEPQGFDALEFGSGGGDVSPNGDYVALGGLFDYSDAGFGSSELSWRSETLPAL